MQGNGPSHDRVSVETLWRHRLKTAKERYDVTSAETKTAMDMFQQRHLPSPDGSFQLVQALRAERSARHEYLEVLRKLTDLIISGKQPDDEQSPKP